LIALQALGVAGLSHNIPTEPRATMLCHNGFISKRSTKVNIMANKQSIIDTAQHVAGIIIGSTLLKLTGKRYNKADRSTKWFSTVSANLAAEGVSQSWTIYL
jgi:hypothetical protein